MSYRTHHPDKSKFAHVEQYSSNPSHVSSASHCVRNGEPRCFLEKNSFCWAIRKSNGQRDLRPCHECPQGPNKEMTICDKKQQCLCNNMAP